MCRYTDHSYRTHYACPDCRLSKKDWPEKPVPCPACGKPMTEMGMDFRPPKKKDQKGWEAVRILLDDGIRFASCGCDGPGFRPKDKRTARSMVALRQKARELGETGENPGERKRVLAELAAMDPKGRTPWTD